MTTSPASPPRMTAAEYFAWERDQTERHDFVNGEIFAMSGGSPRHNALGAAVTLELGIAFRGGPFRLFSADQQIAFRDGEHYVYADISVACEQASLVPGTDVLTNPTIVVEVLSKSTEAYDRGRKWSGYQQLASLTDYLLVSQSSVRVEHFQREPGGEWHYRVATAGGRVTLKNGAVVEVDAIYRGVFDLKGE